MVFLVLKELLKIFTLRLTSNVVLSIRFVIPNTLKEERIRPKLWKI